MTTADGTQDRDASDEPPEIVPREAAGATERTAMGVLAACAVAFVSALCFTPVFNNDFWIQLAVGDLIRETGRIPETVLFTFTDARDNVFTAYEWLPSLLWSHTYWAFGYTGAVWLKGGLALGVFAGVVALCWQRSRSTLLALALASVCMLGINFRTLLRPELFAFVLGVLTLNLLEAYRRSDRPAWLLGLVPVAVVWANAHGSVLVGLVLPLMFAVGALLDAGWTAWRTKGLLDLEVECRRAGWLVAASGAMGVATLMNPYGFGLLAHVFSLSGSDFIRAGIMEWQPVLSPLFRDHPFFVIYVGFSGALAAALVVGRRRVTPSLLVVLVPFWLLSIDAMRHVTWFVVIGTWALAQTIDRPPDSSRARTAIAAVLAIVLAAGTVVVARIGNVRGKRPGFAVDTPLGAEALAFLASRAPRGNVFNSYEYGDQLVYHFYPDVRVAMDSRLDAYGARRYREHQRLSGRLPEIQATPGELIRFLDHYRVDMIVTRPYDFRGWRYGGHDAALAEAGFRLTYRDRTTLVLERGDRLKEGPGG